MAFQSDVLSKNSGFGQFGARNPINLYGENFGSNGGTGGNRNSDDEKTRQRMLKQGLRRSNSSQEYKTEAEFLKQLQEEERSSNSDAPKGKAEISIGGNTHQTTSDLEKRRRIEQAMNKGADNLYLKKDKAGVGALAKGMARGKTANPQQLIGDRRNKLRGQIQSVINNFKFDNSQELKANDQYDYKQVSVPRPKGHVGIHYGTRVEKTLKPLDAKTQALRDTKIGLFKAKVAGLQGQIAELDGVDNKLTLAKGLEDDRDYQDAIKALLTGQPIPTSLDRQKQSDDKELAQQGLDKQGKVTEKDIFSAEMTKFGIKSDERMEHIKGVIAKDMEDFKHSIDSGKLEQGTKKVFETKMLDVNKSISNMVGISKQLIENPDFFNKPTQLKNDLVAAGERWGFKPTPEQADKLANMTGTRAAVGMAIASYVKMMSGAQVSDREREFIETFFVNDKMSVSEARGSLQMILKMTIRDKMIMKEMALKGLDLNDKNAWSEQRSSISSEDAMVIAAAKDMAPGLFKTPRGSAKSGSDGRNYTRERLEAIARGEG